MMPINISSPDVYVNFWNTVLSIAAVFGVSVLVLLGAILFVLIRIWSVLDGLPKT